MKRLLSEVYRFQKIAGLLREYFEPDPETVREAFRIAGIRLSRPVTVVITGFGRAGALSLIDKPYQANPTELIEKLEIEREQHNSIEGNGVIYYYDDTDLGVEPEQYGLDGSYEMKLGVSFSDDYEYLIFQAGGFVPHDIGDLNEAENDINLSDTPEFGGRKYLYVAMQESSPYDAWAFVIQSNLPFVEAFKKAHLNSYGLEDKNEFKEYETDFEKNIRPLARIKGDVLTADTGQDFIYYLIKLK